MKTKIGIITIHDSNNCGALLQAYALQSKLDSMGYDSEFIDHNRFSSNSDNNEKRILNKKKKDFSLLLLLSKIKGIKYIRKDKLLKQEKCEDFKKNKLRISNRKYTEIEEISDEYPIYDAYICGSDQIWNPERFNFSAPFFLSFVPDNKMKISYAPSLGVESIPKELERDYKRLIKRINYVSVREENGAEEVRRITGKNVACVLDPTFLINKNRWIELIKDYEKPTYNYVFCYFLNYMSAYKIKRQLNIYAKNNNLRVIIFHPKCASVSSNWIPAYGLGPLEFLNYIYNSSLVITDSFHGTSLSIIMEKEFYVFSAEKNLPFASRFGRIGNILKKTGLNDRTLDLNQTIEKQKIDYEQVHKKLKNDLNISNNFLSNALDSINKESLSRKDDFLLPYNNDTCVGCGACISICKHNALSMILDKEGFYRPTWDEKKCINCGACLKVCPVLYNKIESNSVKCYYGWNINNDIVKSSSSGGIFSILAEYVFSKNGIVVGATMDKDLKVKHIVMYSRDELYKCRGSKYVQSDMSEVYYTIQKAIEKKKLILFSGTGCQCLSIKKRFKYDDILLCEVVCHGVSSPGIFKDYILDNEKLYNKKITNYSFRDESKGYNKPCVRFDFVNDKSKKIRWFKDCFIQSFSKNKTLRKSCYDCKFSKFPRTSDITIADFWGAKKLNKNFNKDGTSLIIVNTKKGEEIFDKCKVNMKVYEISLEEALKYNKSATSSAKKNNIRDSLFYYYKKNGYQYVKNKYLFVPSLIKKAFNKFKSFL